MSFLTPQEQQLQTVEGIDLANDDIIARLAEEIQKPTAVMDQDLFFELRDKYQNYSFDTFEMRLFKERPLFERYLPKLFRIYDDYAFIDLAQQIILQFNHDYMAGQHYRTLARIFNQVTEETNQTLQDYIEVGISNFESNEKGLSHYIDPNGIGLKTIMEALQDEAMDFAPEMEKPDYIIPIPPNIENMDMPRLEEPVELVEATKEGILNYLMQFMEDERLVAQHFNQAALIRKVENMTQEEIDDFAKEVSLDARDLVSLRRNQLLCSVFGPCNPMNSEDFSELEDEEGEPDVNKIYGGPRMFLDMQFESDGFYESSYSDWYTPNCQQCYRKIPNRYWAVREPVYGGGWSGCYHSWDCVRQSIQGEDFQQDEDFEQEDDASKRKKVQLLLVDAYESFMKECGIFEREEEAVDEDF